MEIRKVEPVEFEFDRTFVNLMEQEPLEAAEKLLRAFMDAMRKNQRLLEDIELNIPDTHDVPTSLLLHTVSTLKNVASESMTEIDRVKMELRVRSMTARRLQADTVQAMQDLFGVLDARQIAKLEKAIGEVRDSLGR